MFAKSAVTADEHGVTVNFFESGTYSVQCGGVPVTIEQKTDYPRDGKIKISVRTSEKKSFALRVRVSAWTGNGGYAVYERAWIARVTSA